MTVFDLANPGASNQTLGFVDGNFNRGMDFDSPTSFYYYVSTDSLNDPGDRGLWYFNGDVNTQLATTGFNDSGDGDASLSADGSTFFVSTDDGDATAGDSIYAFTNLGGTPVFNELFETGLSQIIGLAVHPVSGVMYAYDSSTEGLYTIDPFDGIVTLVGLSGLNLGAIGGMDFNADGSVLLLAQSNDLYTVDIFEGTLTAAGDVGVNVSALSYRVPAPGTLALLGLAGLGVSRRRR
ncbi:MAG: PEP-CTERM sorting domain-containing protein [Phycisphaerales bacterium JB037]